MTVEQSLDMKTLLPCMGRSAVNWNGLLSCKGVQTSRPPLSKIWVFTLVAGSTHKVVKWMDWLIILFKTELIKLNQKWTAVWVIEKYPDSHYQSMFFFSSLMDQLFLSCSPYRIMKPDHRKSGTCRGLKWCYISEFRDRNKNCRFFH